MAEEVSVLDPNDLRAPGRRILRCDTQEGSLKVYLNFAPSALKKLAHCQKKNVSWKTIKTENVVNHYLCSLRGVGKFQTFYEVGCFRLPIMVRMLVLPSEGDKPLMISTTI